jgi:hypothetical protein
MYLSPSSEYQIRPIRANVVVDFPLSGQRKFKARWMVTGWPSFRRGARVVAVFATKKAAAQFIKGEELSRGRPRRRRAQCRVQACAKGL